MLFYLFSAEELRDLFGVGLSFRVRDDPEKRRLLMPHARPTAPRYPVSCMPGYWRVPTGRAR